MSMILTPRNMDINVHTFESRGKMSSLESNTVLFHYVHTKEIKNVMYNMSLN